MHQKWNGTSGASRENRADTYILYSFLIFNQRKECVTLQEKFAQNWRRKFYRLKYVRSEFLVASKHDLNSNEKSQSPGADYFSIWLIRYGIGYLMVYWSVPRISLWQKKKKITKSIINFHKLWYITLLCKWIFIENLKNQFKFYVKISVWKISITGIYVFTKRELLKVLLKILDAFFFCVHIFSLSKQKAHLSPSDMNTLKNHTTLSLDLYWINYFSQSEVRISSSHDESSNWSLVWV